MLLWSTWLKDRPYDIVVVLVIVLLVVSAYGRTGKGKTNPMLLTVNWLVVLLLILSLQPVYNTIDPLLGGHNYTNILQRLTLSASGLAVTISLSKMCKTYYREKATPISTRWEWLIVSAIGLITSFIGMGAHQATNRGLDDYATTHIIAYPSYQLFSILGLLIGVSYLVPRLYKMLQTTSNRTYKIQTSLFLATYILAPIIIALYALSPLSIYIVFLRETFIYTAFICLAVGFMLAVREKNRITAATSR